MLRLEPKRAVDLATAITPHTRGNPYDTVELLNTLRHDGVLKPGDGGWKWDTEALRGLGRADVAELLAERAGIMPPGTQALLEMMACLGGRVELNLLHDASGLAASMVEERLAPALDEGLLVLEPGPQEAVRFRHDRVQEAVLHRLGTRRQHAVRLDLARRLGGRPELFDVAAEQYLPVVDAVSEPDERRLVVELFRRAAEQAELLVNQPARRQTPGGCGRARRPGRHRHAHRVARRSSRRAVRHGATGRGRRHLPDDRPALHRPGAANGGDAGPGEQPDHPEPAP